jgi:hypothetical protein
MVIPTVFWFRTSILYVALVSVYALVVGHWGAYEAAKSSVSQTTLDQVRAQTDALAFFMEAYERENPNEDLSAYVAELRQTLQ